MSKTNTPIKLPPHLCGDLQFLTVMEASKFLGVSQKEVYNSLKLNKFPFIILGSNYRVAVWKKDYKNFLKEQKSAVATG